MSPKKKEDEIEDKIEPKKEPSSKVKPKKERPRRSKVKENDNKLYTLVELVDDLEDTTDIFMKLSKYGYYMQFTQELELKEKGQYITPTITKTEFNKIIQTKF